MAELIQNIADVCLQNGLLYDNMPPVQVSPGVFMISAVVMNEQCKTRGNCRAQNFYVTQTNGGYKLC